MKLQLKFYLLMKLLTVGTAQQLMESVHADTFEEAFIAIVKEAQV